MRTREEILDGVEAGFKIAGQDTHLQNAAMISTLIGVLIDIRDLLAAKFGEEKLRVERIEKEMGKMNKE